MQAFESFLLQDLSEKLGTIVKQKLSKIHSADDLLPFQLKSTYYFWQATFEDADQSNYCPIIISVPTYLIENSPTTATVETWLNEASNSLFDEDFLLGCYVAGVTFRIGSTRVAIKDLDELEWGDVVVLERSHPEKWLIWNDKTHAWVTMPIKLADSIPRYNCDNRDKEDLASGETQSMKSQVMKTQGPNSLHWENLQVDLVATFEPIKFPIKRLKEISEGLVLEISGLMDNSITLCVDGQPVAWGELLVVGDKFAVKIQGLCSPDGKKDSGVDPTYSTSQHDSGSSNSVNVAQATQATGSQQQVQTTVTTSQPEVAMDEPQPDILEELDIKESDFEDLDEDWS
jgi:flagellar motor switch protein FliN